MSQSNEQLLNLRSRNDKPPFSNPNEVKKVMDQDETPKASTVKLVAKEGCSVCGE